MNISTISPILPWIIRVTVWNSVTKEFAARNTWIKGRSASQFRWVMNNPSLPF
jgi:hypothetical protein